MRHQWGKIFRQAGRAAAGAGLLMAINGLAAPLYVFLSFPDAYQENLEFPGLTTWILSGALGSLLLGAPQGFASEFATGLADVLWRDRSRRIMRIIFGAISGLVLTFFILLGEIGATSISPALYYLLNILFGLMMGAIITITIPRLGEPASRNMQLRRAFQACSFAVIVILVIIFLIYQDEFILFLPFRVMMAILIPLGVALSLIRQQKDN